MVYEWNDIYIYIYIHICMYVYIYIYISIYMIIHHLLSGMHIRIYGMSILYLYNWQAKLYTSYLR